MGGKINTSNNTAPPPPPAPPNTHTQIRVNKTTLSNQLKEKLKKKLKETCP